MCFHLEGCLGSESGQGPPNASYTDLVHRIHVTIFAEWVGMIIIIKLWPGRGFQYAEYAGQRGHQHRFPGVPMIAIALESDG